MGDNFSRVFDFIKFQESKIFCFTISGVSEAVDPNNSSELFEIGLEVVVADFGGYAPKKYLSFFVVPYVVGADVLKGVVAVDSLPPKPVLLSEDRVVHRQLGTVDEAKAF